MSLGVYSFYSVGLGAAPCGEGAGEFGEVVLEEGLGGGFVWVGVGGVVCLLCLVVLVGHDEQGGGTRGRGELKGGGCWCCWCSWSCCCAS